MEQPKISSGIPTMPGYVCQLHKSMYGLRQADEIWGSVIQSKVISWGFHQSTEDSSLYFYKKGNNFINLIILVYDLPFRSNDWELVTWFKNLLSSTFKVKLLG